MIDANFKQKHRAKKNDDDVDLCNGKAYFVEDSQYKQFLKEHVSEKQVRTFTDDAMMVLTDRRRTHAHRFYEPYRKQIPGEAEAMMLAASLLCNAGICYTGVTV